MRNINNIHGFILAAGYGTRMKILSDCRWNKHAAAKPAFPVGRNSMVRHQLHLMQEMGIKKVTVAVKYKPESVLAALGDVSKLGLDIEIFDLNEEGVEDWGAAWTVYRWLAPRMRGGFDPDGIVVFNGDILWDRSYAKPFIESFGRSNAWAHIAACETPMEQIYGRFGAMQLESPTYLFASKVRSFVEKPNRHDVGSHIGNFANVGIFALDPELFRYFDPEYSTAKRSMGRDFCDFAYDLFQEGMIQEGLPLEAFVAQDGFYWKDIGDPTALLQANFDILKARVDAGYQGKEIKPGVWIGAGVSLSPSLLKQIKPPVIIGDNVQLHKTARIGPNVVIGAGWDIRKDAKIMNSLLLPPYNEDDIVRVIGPRMRLNRCIVVSGHVETMANKRQDEIIIQDQNGFLGFLPHTFNVI
ncbi:MAG: NDP-sugar synthase [Candidatus Margulisiibacteriota bacterium]